MTDLLAGATDTSLTAACTYWTSTMCQALCQALGLHEWTGSHCHCLSVTCGLLGVADTQKWTSNSRLLQVTGRKHKGRVGDKERSDERAEALGPELSLLSRAGVWGTGGSKSGNSASRADPQNWFPLPPFTTIVALTIQTSVSVSLSLQQK